MANDLDLAWAAGFFDGEGSIGIYKRHHAPTSFALTVSLSQVDPRPLRRFAAIVGGHIDFCKPRGNQRPYWRWYDLSGGAADVLAAIYSGLSSKREQASVALEYQGTVEARGAGKGVRLTDAQRAQRAEYAFRVKELKSVVYA